MDPAPTTIDGGAASTVFTVARRMLVLPEAALVSVTVHVLAELGPRLVGLQAREETTAEATRVTVVLEELPL